MKRISHRPGTCRLSLSGSPSVAVFEWVCGGGLLGTAAEDISPPLMAEGQAMLRTLVAGLASAGLQVVVPLDVRLFTPTVLAQLASQAQILSIEQRHSPDYLSAWRDVASSCTWSWLVAPELDDTLRQIACQLRIGGAQLLNASDEFLTVASDKLACAQLWQAAGIPHPPTCTLQTIDEDWLSNSFLHSGLTHSSFTQNDLRWVVKRCDGAGGEGLRIVDRGQLMTLKNSPAMSIGGPRMTPFSWIVQPWLPGIAASCSAIVDVRGRAHWLPLVSQDFEIVCSPSHLQAGPIYRGCTYPAPGIPQPVPIDLLHKTLSSLPGTALGWVGVDLLYDPAHAKWWVIEINPRCTSSLVGLATAYRDNLVFDGFRLQTNAVSQLADDFRAVVFQIGQHRDY